MSDFRNGGYALALALLSALLWTACVPFSVAAAGGETVVQAEPKPTATPGVVPASESAVDESTVDEAGGGRTSYLGVIRGYVLPNTMQEDWSDAASGVSAHLMAETDRGSLTGGQTGFMPAQFGKLVALEVEQTKQSAAIRMIQTPSLEDGKPDVSGFYTATGDSSVVLQSTMFNLLLRYPEGRIHPYIGIGAGINRTTISFSEQTITGDGPGSERSGTTTDLAFQVLAGVEYEVGPRLAIGLGYRFFLPANLTFEWANGSRSEYGVNTHSVAFTTKTYR